MKRAWIGLGLGLLLPILAACGAKSAAVPPPTTAPAPPAVAATSTVAPPAPTVAPTAMPTDAAPAIPDLADPLALFDAPYNPFVDVAWSATYSVYQVRLNTEYGGEYILDIHTSDDIESVVRLVGSLVGEDTEDKVAENMGYVARDGGVAFDGLLQGTDRPAKVQVRTVDTGVEFSITAAFGDDAPLYERAMAQSVNLDLLVVDGRPDDLLGSDRAAVIGFSVNRAEPGVRWDARYALGDDYAAQRDYYRSDAFMAAMRRGSGTEPLLMQYGDVPVLKFEQNQIWIEIMMDDVAGEITIAEASSVLDRNLSEYTTPSVAADSLTALGFRIFAGGGTDCSIDDQDTGFYFAISKVAWGADRDYIVAIADLYDKYHLEYDPATGRYLIDLEDQGLIAACYYDPQTGAIESMGSDWDVRDVQANLATITGQAPDEAAAYVVAYLTGELDARFGKTIDQLWALEIK